MEQVWAGIVVLAITAATFWYCLPRNGKMHRLVGTELEPYVAVALVCGVALGGSLILSWTLE
jgi:hypothetical protein